ncbi:bacterial transcription activator, effector binding domain [Variibacter gotjawalensis]|uniref:Bacterial transcription activator, effector binding domain n=1 Tax=Variibacter gotjawalensis TaxID=1333996 RepID=A0A0S3PS28_9BRAD|nr:GyrI-like domain-containing protein [Variibacter gotjawalensis]NIK49053.1 effector-binding domain-containing protein [Variibacter gotjawalensis]RZS50909.1 effector-binding domain-containing protein [Variibacter gotjawalensis]BAT58743.1 bacterial transcription activator, effector binding domain [Variibacter gotjawalensis]
MVRALQFAAILLLTGSLSLNAQTPAPTPPADPQPAQPAPAQPAPAQPPAAQPAPPDQPPANPDFGVEVTVPPRTIVFLKGTANWDSAYDTLIDSFKTLNDFLKRESLTAAGSPLTIYTSTDDTGFQFQAAIPIEKAPANPPKGDIEIGQAPSGKMLKFIHRGSYDNMDATYEAITNFLDTKQLEAQDTFVEEYVTDPLTTAEDQLVISVLVPVKSN